MTDHLVGGQRPAELLADFGIVERHVEHDLHDADSFGAERGQRAVDHAFDFRQRVAAVAEQRVGGKVNAGQIEVAGAAAAEPRIIPQAETCGA